MNNLQIFKNEQFGAVRTIEIANEPWFVGKDVADILEYQNGSRDINRHVDEEDRRKKMIFDGTQNKETIVINESGLYSLIFSSHLPTAKQFKHWVTSVVLPSIRKTGSYSMKSKEYPPKSSSIGEGANVLKLVDKVLMAQRASGYERAKALKQEADKLHIPMPDNIIQPVPFEQTAIMCTHTIKIAQLQY